MTKPNRSDTLDTLAERTLTSRLSRRALLKRTGIASLSVIPVAALLAACRRAAVPETPTALPGTPSGAPATPTVIIKTPALGTATPVGTSQAVIVQAMGLDIDELDPHYFKSIPGYYAVCNLYEMMLDYEHIEQEDGGLYPAADEAGNWKFTPWIAESYSVSEDQKTITFKLRRDVTFSDGSPMTAKDVKATWDRAVTGKGYANIVTNMMGIKSVDQIVMKDDYTIEVQLEKPNPFALKMIPINVMSVMSAKALEEHATSADPTAHEWFHRNAFGSAPYVLKSWIPGEQWELAPNPNYWDPKRLKNGGTVVKTIPSAAERYNLLIRGDVDVAYDLQPKDLDALRQNPDIQLIQFKVPWPYYLGLNNKIPPFDNVKVRQAVSYAIPYKTIIEKVLYGFGQECKSPVAQGMPTSDFSFWHYDTDPAKTKQLLEEAGVSGLQFDLNILQGRPQDEQIAVWIQAGLAEAGVQVRINKMPDSEWYEKFNARQHQSFIGEWYSWVNDPMYHLFWNFHSKAPTNATGYSNPEVDRLIDEGLYETDLAKREQMSKQAQKIIVEEAPWAILYQINYTIAVRKNIKGFNWYPDVGTRFWKVSKV